MAKMGSVVFGSNVKFVWSGVLSLSSEAGEWVMQLAMRDKRGVATKLRVKALQQHGWTECRWRWGVYWLAEHRTPRGIVKGVGGIWKRHTTTGVTEVSQFWRVRKSCRKDEGRRLAKAGREKWLNLRVHLKRWNCSKVTVIN